LGGPRAALSPSELTQLSWAVFRARERLYRPHQWAAELRLAARGALRRRPGARHLLPASPGLGGLHTHTAVAAGIADAAGAAAEGAAGVATDAVAAPPSTWGATAVVAGVAAAPSSVGEASAGGRGGPSGKPGEGDETSSDGDGTLENDPWVSCQGVDALLAAVATSADSSSSSGSSHSRNGAPSGGAGSDGNGSDGNGDSNVSEAECCRLATWLLYQPPEVLLRLRKCLRTGEEDFWTSIGPKNPHQYHQYQHHHHHRHHHQQQEQPDRQQQHTYRDTTASAPAPRLLLTTLHTACWPGPAWLDALAAAATSQLTSPAFRAQNLGIILWSLAGLGYRPP
ncbi:hypothetical protein Agub_g9501, partial [Astrephomene gubernaculifera]